MSADFLCYVSMFFLGIFIPILPTWVQKNLPFFSFEKDHFFVKSVTQMLAALYLTIFFSISSLRESYLSVSVC